MEFKNIEEILEYAISNEEKAESLYTQLADRVGRPGMREAFLDFANEERSHKARLLKIKAGKLSPVAEETVLDLKLTEHLVEPEPTANMTYPEALLFAMKAEKAAFILYTRLAEVTGDAALSKIFQNLAQEEAKHKLRFELEYDEHVLEGV